MKEFIKKCLDGHIVDGKLDTFGSLTLIFVLISIQKHIANETSQALKELGLSTEKENGTSI